MFAVGEKPYNLAVDSIQSATDSIRCYASIPYTRCVISPTAKEEEFIICFIFLLNRIGESKTVNSIILINIPSKMVLVKRKKKFKENRKKHRVVLP